MYALCRLSSPESVDGRVRVKEIRQLAPSQVQWQRRPERQSHEIRQHSPHLNTSCPCLMHSVVFTGRHLQEERNGIVGPQDVSSASFFGGSDPGFPNINVYTTVISAEVVSVDRHESTLRKCNLAQCKIHS